MTGESSRVQTLCGALPYSLEVASSYDCARACGPGRRAAVRLRSWLMSSVRSCAERTTRPLIKLQRCDGSRMTVRKARSPRAVFTNGEGFEG
jgi:hypothetical protein